MIFTDVAFWDELGIVDLLKKTAGDRPYREWITSSDSHEEILHCLLKYRRTFSLPVVTDEELTSKFWMKQTRVKQIIHQAKPTVLERSSFPLITRGKFLTSFVSENIPTFLIGATVGLFLGLAIRKSSN